MSNLHSDSADSGSNDTGESVVEAIDSFTETAVDALSETGAENETIERVKSESDEVSDLFDEVMKQVEEAAHAHERLRDEYFSIPVVERVLLEYGLFILVVFSTSG